MHEAEHELDLESATGGPARVRAFAELCDGLEEEVREAGDGALANRIAACRDVGADAFERYLEQALAAVRAALPMRHAGGASRLMSLRPDVGRMPARAALGAAKAAAHFLIGCGPSASRLNREGPAEAIADKAVEAVRVYAGDLVSEIRAAEGEERERAKRLMSAVLELCDVLLASNEVDLIRRRAAAAALAA